MDSISSELQLFKAKRFTINELKFILEKRGIKFNRSKTKEYYVNLYEQHIQNYSSEIVEKLTVEIMNESDDLLKKKTSRDTYINNHQNDSDNINNKIKKEIKNVVKHNTVGFKNNQNIKKESNIQNNLNVINYNIMANTGFSVKDDYSFNHEELQNNIPAKMVQNIVNIEPLQVGNTLNEEKSSDTMNNIIFRNSTKQIENNSQEDDALSCSNDFELYPSIFYSNNKCKESSVMGKEDTDIILNNVDHSQTPYNVDHSQTPNYIEKNKTFTITHEFFTLYREILNKNSSFNSYYTAKFNDGSNVFYNPIKIIIQLCFFAGLLYVSYYYGKMNGTIIKVIKREKTMFEQATQFIKAGAPYVEYIPYFINIFRR